MTAEPLPGPGASALLYRSGLAAGPPLLLVHDVGLGAGAATLEPLAARLGDDAVRLELPGFGAAAQGRLAYTPALMQRSITRAARHLGPPVHLLSVGLACEFAALAAAAAPRLFGTLAFVGPTGLEHHRAEVYDAGATNERPLLQPLLGSRPAGLLLDAIAPQGSAQAAIAAWLAGALATRGIAEVYARLAMPVWVAHGEHGRGADVGALARFGPPSHWRVERFAGGPRPFEHLPERFVQRYRAFLDAATASSPTRAGAPR